MSHWLSNVNNLLTKLDDQVETVVEEWAFSQDDLSREAISVARTGIDDILAKRGLSSTDSKDETKEEAVISEVEKKTAEADEDEKKSIENEILVSGGAIEHTKGTDTTTKAESEPINDDAPGNTSQQDVKREELDKLKKESPISSAVQQDPGAVSFKTHAGGEPEVSRVENEAKLSQIVDLQKAETTSGENKSNPAEQRRTNASMTPSTLSKARDKSMLSTPPSPQISKPVTNTAPEIQDSSSVVFDKERTTKEIQALVIERKEAQKEARTLRRHIVSLNDQLETAESELQAQRKELERAAERMEKDRSRHKEEKEASRKRNNNEVALLKTQHDKNIKEQQARFEEQLDRYRRKLSDEEKRRKQEGGDWDKEMSNAIDREHDMRQALNSLEDEKAILLSQIATLQGQQTALGSRLESLSEAADNAMRRERDAENRLDVALNQHARQIGHRQARESQLERTIQDLNAALVLSRGNGQHSGNDTSGRDGSATDSLRGNSHLQARISALESDLQASNSNLAIEKERSETLQMQLRSFSNETTQEATIVHAKEIRYDRQIADMSLTISKLEAKLQQYEKVSRNDLNTPVDSFNDQKIPDNIKVLSEEVVRLRDKVANYNSESLAMKNRLKAAINKSNRLEEELQIAKVSRTNCDDLVTSSSMQSHRTVNGGRRRNAGAASGVSIRTAMQLNSFQGNRTEQIGQVVDQIDSFAASTGMY